MIGSSPRRRSPTTGSRCRLTRRPAGAHVRPPFLCLPNPLSSGLRPLSRPCCAVGPPATASRASREIVPADRTYHVRTTSRRTSSDRTPPITRSGHHRRSRTGDPPDSDVIGAGAPASPRFPPFTDPVRQMAAMGRQVAAGGRPAPTPSVSGAPRRCKGLFGGITPRPRPRTLRGAPATRRRRANRPRGR